MDIWFLFSANHLMVIYIFTKFMKIFSMVLKLYRADMISIGKNSKGHNSFFLCTSSDDGLYLYKVL